VLASVGFVTGRDIAARFVAREVPSVLIAAVTAVVVTGLAYAGSLFVDWRPITWRGAGLLMLAQGALLVGYLAVVAAMRRGEVSFVAPFRHSSLLASVATGFLLFGTFPAPLTLLGAGVVVASGVALIWGARRGAAAEGTPPGA
jgi:S-adenosylmethionine uptake transporter